jgi:hypothetical protein
MKEDWPGNTLSRGYMRRFASAVSCPPVILKRKSEKTIRENHQVAAESIAARRIVSPRIDLRGGLLVDRGKGCFQLVHVCPDVKEHERSKRYKEMEVSPEARRQEAPSDGPIRNPLTRRSLFQTAFSFRHPAFIIYHLLHLRFGTATPPQRIRKLDEQSSKLCIEDRRHDGPCAGRG